MAFLFIGGETEDYSGLGAASFDTSGSGVRWRAAYARGSITWAASSNSTPYVTFAASTTFWATYQFNASQVNASGGVGWWLALGTAGNARLRFRWTGSSPSTVILETWNGTSAVTLATSTLTMASSTQYKIDVSCDYRAAGRVKLYVNQALYIDYSGDVTAAGATTLNNLIFGSQGSASTLYVSEIIVTDGDDTRPLSVKTLVPNATGDTTAWTSGTWAEIDEPTATDIDLAVSDTANQILTVNCTGMPTGASGLSVRAVKSVAFAARGAAGPSKLALGVRQSSTNAFASGATLDTGYGTVSQTWTANPVTGAAFTGTEIENIQLAYRSEA
jgi:hypothetical protein